MDASTGTTGNDTFNATGATLGVQDVITGGTGTDKLVIVDTTSVSAAGLTAATITGVEALELNANGGMGANAIAAVPAVAGGVATAAVAQVGTLVLSGAYATNDTINVTVGSTIHTVTVPSTTNTNTGGQSEAAGAIKTLLDGLLADSVTVAAVTTGTTWAATGGTHGIVLTAKVAGKPIAVSVANLTVAGTGSAAMATVAAAQGTPSSVTSFTANTQATGAAAIAEVRQIKLTGSTAFVGKISVTIDGTTYTGASSTGETANATTLNGVLAADTARIINSVLGKDVATATAGTDVGTIVITAPVAGVQLPNINVVYALAAAGNTLVAPTEAHTILANSSVKASAAVAEVAAVAAVPYVATGFADSVTATVGGDINTTLAATAKANLTTTAGTATVSGGLDVTVKATKAVTVGGAALTNATVTTATTSAVVAIGASTGTTSVTPKLVTANVTGGSDVLVTDYTGGASAKTLTAVTITGTGDTTVTLQGDALTTLTVGKQTTATAITITNSATAEHDLVLNVADSGASGQVVTVTNNTAKSAVVNAAGTNNFVKLDGDGSLIKVTTTGAGKMSLDLDGSNNGVTSFDGSASTGALTLSNIAAATISVKTGSGSDTLTTIHTAKATVDTGTGDDALTIDAALAAGSTVNLGAGDDRVLKGTSGSVATDTTADVTSVDGGAGNDVIGANLITAGNGDQFINFETLGLVSATIDATLLTKSTITGLELLVGGGTYTGINNSQALKVATLGMSGTTTLTMSGLTGLADGYTINFTEANAAARTAAPTSANVDAGTVVTSGIENYTINSGGTFTWNKIDLGANTSANTVTVTGASNLDLTFASGFGNTTAPRTGVSLIDGSAATGKLAITTTNVVPATAGFAVKGGSGADSITTAGEVITLTLGAGVDTVHADANKLDTTATATAAEVVGELITVTDFAVGDKIDFSTATLTLATTAVAAKTDVTTSTSFLTAVNLAAVGGGNGNTEVNWFVYGGDTYLLFDLASSTTAGVDVDDGDVVVKITGIHDFARSTLGTDGVFTYVG